MCDCCTINCHECGTPIEVHIGDFSVSREHVHPFCGKAKCQRAALRVLLGKRWLHTEGMGHAKAASLGESFIVFSCVLMADETGAYPEAKRGDVVLFLVDRPRSIHVNA